jgi:hypothetical protein
MRNRVVTAIVILAATASIAIAQRRLPERLPPGTSTIAGQVIDAETTQPVAGAEVTVSAFTAGIGRGGTIKTGADGAFAIENIDEGMYVLAVRAPGYLTGCFPNPEAPASCGSINLVRDQKRHDVKVSLIRGAIARGRIVNQQGAPIAGATVRMGSPRQPRNEIARTILFSSAPVVSAADGTFELRGIPPGEWNIELELAAQPGSIRPPTIFYPGVFDDDQASTVEFSAGRVTGNLVVVVPAVADNTLTVRVSPGVLSIGDVRASLIKPVPFVSRSIALNEEGIGEIKGLVEGRYFIAARGWIKEKAWAAFAVADFISPSLDLSLQLAPAGSISGKIVAKNGGLPPLAGVIAAATWVHDNAEVNPVTPDQVPVAPDGSFRIEGLFGTRTLQLIYLDADWHVASILVGRSEVNTIEVPLDTAVDVTVVVARR